MVRPMPEALWYRLHAIRLRGKFGKEVTEEERHFCTKCWEDYPEAYERMDKFIVEEAMQALNPLWGKEQR